MTSPPAAPAFPPTPAAMQDYFWEQGDRRTAGGAAHRGRPGGHAGEHRRRPEALAGAMQPSNPPATEPPVRPHPYLQSKPRRGAGWLEGSGGVEDSEEGTPSGSPGAIDRR